MKTREPILAAGAPFGAIAFASVWVGSYLLHGVTMADWTRWGTDALLTLWLLPWGWIGAGLGFIGFALHGLRGDGSVPRADNFVGGLIAGLLIAVWLFR